MIRTLPITVAPLSGEGVDSWLETTAHRLQCSFDDLQTAMGLFTPDNRWNQWIITLPGAALTNLAAASDLAPPRIAAMTLSHYAGRAVGVDPQTGAFVRRFPWGRGRGSRYCPHCLAGTGGRWLLRWRLGWTFACLEHRCLLLDACPACGRAQRLLAHPGKDIPDPGRCANPVRGPTNAPIRCGADLTAAPALPLGARHPAIAAQYLIDTAIDTGAAQFGVYGTHPVSAEAALADLRAIGGRILSSATAGELAAVAAADILAEHRHRMNHPDPRFVKGVAERRPGLAAPAYAATTAVAVSGAMTILNAPSFEAATDAAGWLVLGARSRGLIVRATTTRWGHGMTDWVRSIQLHALAPELSGTDQLRYRIGIPLAGQPGRRRSSARALAAHLPTLLWPDWWLRMAIPGCHRRLLRPALSAAVLITGHRIALPDAVALLGCPLSANAVTRVIRLLSRDPHWPAIRAALYRLADYLHADPVPIDYRRRRTLDYETLLPDPLWAQMCRATGTNGQGPVSAAVARQWLRTELSAVAAPTAAPNTPLGRVLLTVPDFPRRLNPGLHDALITHAAAFLADRGINEPPLWQPPADLIADLQLPRPAPGLLDIAEVHRCMSRDRRCLRVAASRTGATLDEIRYLLSTHPAPPASTADTPTPHYRRNPTACADARAALPRERLIELYQHQKISLRHIAEGVGVSRGVISRLARDYGLDIRPPHRGRTLSIDRDWLYHQHITRGRTLYDIAAELGVAVASMTRWARILDIPARRLSCPADFTGQLAAIPAILHPALATAGGWERLHHFATALNYPTLQKAAAAQGIPQASIITQMKRLERDLGQPLLKRAKRGTPMTASDFGNRVAKAVTELPGPIAEPQCSLTVVGAGAWALPGRAVSP